MQIFQPISPGLKTDSRFLTGLCAGANVRTPIGARHVDKLHPGDLVVTRTGGLQPVRMIWSRTVSVADMAARPELAPVRLRPRALGPMMPARDLRIGCGHRVLVPGYRLSVGGEGGACLMQVGALADVSDDAFFQPATGPVTFYNIVFDSHQVFTADGLPVESFLPSSGAIAEMDVAAQAALFALFPDISATCCRYPGLSLPTAQAGDYRTDLA